MTAIADLSIVIVSYNSTDILGPLLASLVDPTSPSAEVIVVENGAEPGHTLPAVQGRAVVVYHMGRNAGFARASNVGVGMSRGGVVLLLNPDTRLRPGALRAAYERVVGAGAAVIVGARSVGRDGRPHHQAVGTFPDVWTFPCLALGLAKRRPVPQSDGPVDVDAVLGAFMMMRRDVWDRLGGLDERYFLFAEDIDLCLRAQRLGIGREICTGAVIEHHGGTIPRHDLFKARCFVDANSAYLKRHFPPLAAWLGVASLRLWLARRLAAGWLSARRFRHE